MEKNITKYLSDIGTHQPKVFTLSNGIRVVFEEDGKYPTAAIGVLVPSGARFEDKSTSGLSHFMEHMLFQGTEHRTSFEISSAIENVGGELNAFTDVQDTLYLMHVSSMHVPLALEVLADMIIHPLFSEKAIQSEAKVVKQEIYRSQDEPGDAVGEGLLKAVYGGDPLANITLGSIESVSSFTHQDFVAYHQKHYLAPGLVISIAGTADMDEALNDMEKTFGQIPTGPVIPKWEVPVIFAKKIVVEKPTEQVHIAMALPGYPIYSKESFSATMAAVILGGNMSSRLFQRMRNQEPLVYTTGASTTDFSNTGFLEISAETSPENAGRVQEVLLEQIEKMHKEKISKEELQHAKDAVLGSLLLGMESSFNRMSRNATAIYLRGSIRGLDEVVKQINATTMEMMEAVIEHIFDISKLATSIVHGPEK
jgi:predicted Zn-dependent peptidase